MRRLLLSGLAILGLLATYFFDQQYRDQITLDNERLLELVMLDAREDLELIINTKRNAVNDLRAFLLLDPQAPDLETFNNYSTFLYENYQNVRAFQYTDRELFIRYIYPLEGNEAALNLDLKTSTSLPYVEKAIKERETTISDPVIAAQGPWIIVLRSPLYDGDEFFGLAQVVVDIDVLAQQMSIINREEVIFQLFDGQDNKFLGPADIGEQKLSTYVSTGDNMWRMDIAWARPPYQADPVIAAFIWGAGMMLTITMFYASNRIWLYTRELGVSVEQRTEALERAQQTAGMGIWEFDVVNQNFNASTSTYALFGLEAGTPLDQEKLIDLIHPEDQVALMELTASLPRDGEAEIEHRVITKDGGTRWLFTKVELDFNKAGNPTISRGISIDITQRKQAQLALERAQLIAGMGSWARDLETGKLSETESARQLYGIEEGEALTIEWMDERVHPDDYTKRDRFRQRLHREGHAEFEHRLLMPDGSIRWLWVQSQMEHDADDKPIRTVSTSIDITKRKEVELALERAQHIAGLGSWQLDMQTNIFTLSETAKRIYGLEPGEEMTNEWLDKHIHPNDHQKRMIFGQRLTEEGQGEYETRLLMKNGSVRWLWVQCQLEYDMDGSNARVLGTSMDITKRKNAELAVEHQLKRLSSLHEIDLAIVASLDLELTLNVLTRQVIDQLGVDAVTVLQFTETQRLDLVAHSGFRLLIPRDTTIPMGKSIAGNVAQTRKPWRVQQAPAEDFPPELSRFMADEGFSSYYALPMIAKGELLGVLELFNKEPFPADREWDDFLETLISQAAIAIQNAVLVSNLQQAKQELEIAYDATLEGWVQALDLRDKETEGHTRRVTDTTMQLARAMNIAPEQLVHIRRGALLHDIGKLAVPDEILLKPGPLTSKEWEIMQAHTTYARNFLKHIDYLRPASNIPYSHHEKWDGTGYPEGLKGEQIPLAARLFAVVDVWDALSNDRPYRKAWKTEKVHEYLREQSGQHFEPRIVKAFMEQVLGDK